MPKFTELPDDVQAEGWRFITENRPVRDFHQWLNDHGVESEVSFTAENFKPKPELFLIFPIMKR